MNSEVKFGSRPSPYRLSTIRWLQARVLTQIKDLTDIERLLVGVHYMPIINIGKPANIGRYEPDLRQYFNLKFIYSKTSDLHFQKGGILLFIINK